MLRAAFLALAALLALALGSYLVLTQTTWGRARVCASLNEQVSAGIAGDLRVERLDEIALPRVKAHGVTILAPDGKPAIEVDDVEITIDLEAVWNGNFAWHRADIRGGTVHVTEDEHGRVNMEETFRAAPGDRGDEPHGTASGESPLDLRKMVTSDMVLVIGGGSLPSLRLAGIDGIMRVHVLPNEEVEIRFDEYRGSIVKGLPTGRLDFRQVEGQVQTAGARLLRFEGQGKSEGAPVEFVLDIHTEPRTKVEIDARFPDLSAESMATLGFAAWTKLVPGLNLSLRHGRK